MGHPTIRRARGLIDSGRPDLAAELLITVKPESPDQDYDRWTALAAALTLTGDLDRALDSADRAVSLNPEGLDGLIARTRLLHRMGREARPSSARSTPSGSTPGMRRSSVCSPCPI